MLSFLFLITLVAITSLSKEANCCTVPTSRLRLRSMLTVLDVVRADGDTTVDHPPIPTTTLPSLPSDFDDIPKGNLQCWESYFGHSFTRNFLYTEFGKSTTKIETTFSPPRSYSSTYSYNKDIGCTTTTLGLTTLCDNIPRASARDI